jgi:hypothetical protein
MSSLHKTVPTAKQDSAMAQLEQFLAKHRCADQPVDNLEEFERELHRLFCAAEA